MIAKIKKELSTTDMVNIVIDNSNWKLHSVLGEYTKNELFISTAFTDGFNEQQQKSIQYYLDNEDYFYNLFIEKIKRLLEFEDFYDYDFEPAFEAYDLELPETITIDWLKTNVKLNEINIYKAKENYCFLEFDFAVSWDDEHGMRALVHKDKFLAFAEGGTIWSYDLADYENDD